MAAVVMAELFVASHFYVRQAAVGFAGIEGDVEEAAMVDARAVSWCSPRLRFLWHFRRWRREP
jgi:ABC-type molybdate transport system permease subunit